MPSKNHNKQLPSMAVGQSALHASERRSESVQPQKRKQAIDSEIEDYEQD